MSSSAQLSVDYYFVDGLNQTQYVYNAEKIAQIATDDVTQIDLKVLISKDGADLVNERTYHFVLRGTGLTAPGESFPIMGPTGTTLVGDDLTMLGKLRRTFNAVQQAGLGVHPKSARDRAAALSASNGLQLVGDAPNEYYIAYVYPSNEQPIYFANRQPAWVEYSDKIVDIAGNVVGVDADYGATPISPYTMDIFENWTVSDFFFMFYDGSAAVPTEGVLSGFDTTKNYIDLNIMFNGMPWTHDGKQVKSRVYRYAVDEALFIHDAMRRLDAPTLFGPPIVALGVRVEEFDNVSQEVVSQLVLT